MAPAETVETANPGPGARAAEEDRNQDVVMTKQPKKPEGKLKPQHAVELSSSDSYESEQDKEAPKTPEPPEGAAKAPRTPESPEAAAKAPRTPESPVAAAKAPKTPESPEAARAPKARRNRRAIQEGMVKCPICWTPVKKDGLDPGTP